VLEEQFADGETSTGPQWVRPAACSVGACVEVAFYAGAILVRDSKNPSSASLSYTPVEWRAFIAGVKSGQFDLTS
jgi:Domain of unknown function (DUF397)